MFHALRHRLVSFLIVPFLCLCLLSTACGADEAAEAAGDAPSDPAANPVDDPSGGTEPVGDDRTSSAGDAEHDEDPADDGETGNDGPTDEPVPVDDALDEPLEQPVELPNEIVVDAPGIVLEEVDGDPQVTEPTHGEIEVPAWLDALLFSRGLVGQIGTDYGRDLAHLDAHLHDDVLYWYVLTEQDTVLEIDMPELTLEVPRMWSMPGQGRSVVVFDPQSGYFYVGTVCPGVSSPVNVELHISNYQGGCGIGVVLDGSIPVDYTLADSIHDDFDSLNPQVVVDGEFPVGPVNVAGSLFVDLDPNGLKAVATGQFSMGLPGKLAVVPISVPFGNGTLGIDRRMDGLAMIEKTWVNGYLGDDIISEGAFGKAADFLALEGDVDLDGFLHRRLDPAGLPTWEDDSYLDVVGDGRWSPQRMMPGGIDHNLLDGEFEGRFDVHGLRGSGRITGTPFAFVDLKGEGDVDFEMLYDDLAAGFIQIDGVIEVSGVELVEAGLRIDESGVAVAGKLGVGGNFVAIAGRIGPDGVQLSGEAGVTIDLTNLDGLAAKIAGERGEDETIERLEAEIDELAPHAAIQRRLDDIEEAYEDIAARERVIDFQEDVLDDLADLWESYTTLQKVGKSVSHGLKVAAANAIIAGAKVDIGRLRLVIAGADTIVDLYEQFVPDAQPVDVERFEALKELLRKLKWERFWSNVRGVIAGVVRGAGTLLEAFGLDVRIEGRVAFSIGTDGFDADVIAQVCGDDWCVGIDSSSVDIGTGRTCINVGGDQNCTTV